MELNREQIKKAMECCYDNNLSCIDCPFQDTDKYFECSNLANSALALINELTEENAKLHEQNAIQVVTAIELDKQVQRLTEENERLRAECTQLIRYPTLYEALEAIIWYDGHSDWLKELCGKLEEAKKEGKNYPNPLPIDAWHTEQHTIWMLLVGMFGDWGTSIRGGWIEKHDECIAFINKIIKKLEDEQ